DSPSRLFRSPVAWTTGRGCAVDQTRPRASSAATDWNEMTTALQLTADDALRPRLAQLAANVLRIPVADIHPAMPFASMGLDSLAAAELTALIEDEFSRELPAALLFECPTLESLSRFIESLFAGTPLARNNSDSKETSIAGMLADAILPSDIVPSCTEDPLPDDVLLTG